MPLDSYRRKRSADQTPEPFGGKAIRGSGPLQFVVHHHAARNTHYDLRLEMEGVLRSWAVPKGPSPSVRDKRFAALVEDHPLEYGDFEGRIPDGNYGAGWTIVWDRGTWHPVGDPLLGLKKGKLLFELRGHKLHGRWTLVRMKSGDKDWLFIKEIDDYMDESLSTDSFPMNSVYTGLSLEQLDAGFDPAKRLGQRVARLKPGAAPRKKPKPMLATAGEPFSRKGWVFEIKYDGYRLLCVKDGDDVALVSRNGNNLSETFPEITAAVARLPFPQLVLDGEAVCHDAGGLPSFSRMQKRGRLSSPSAIARAMREHPATFYAFDLLEYGRRDLREQPLLKRKDLLRDVVPEAGVIRYSDHIDKDGQAMYHAAEEMGLEGIVGKRADSRYLPRRSDAWIKVRVDRTDDFVIAGYKQDSKGALRSLSVAQYIDGELTYSGNVGSGINAALGKELRSGITAGKAARAPINAPAGQEYCWHTPALVCEVRFKEITPGGQLRHPVFLRLREDKDPAECTRDALGHELAEVEVVPEEVQREVLLSNRDKVFWPDEGLTKGDMLDYYEQVAPHLLPWLADRPLVMTRYPDGIDGKSFYQKDAPGFVPDWLRVEKLYSESTERDIGYFVVDSVEALLYIANMASIPLHIYHSRLANLEHPDWCVLDLDPKEAPFADVVKIAKAIHRLCDDLAMPNYVKTSGSTGLHILLPLQNQFTFEQSRVLGELISRVIVRELPDIATVVRNPERREGKVYIDYLQNGAGKLIAAPYCVRPKPGAPVSMPIEWREVNGKLRPDSFTITNAMRRLARKQVDPALAVLEADVDLLAVLESLSAKFAG